MRSASAILTPNTVTVHTTKTAKLSCAVDGIPTPDVNWYKNGRRIGECVGDLGSKIKRCDVFTLSKRYVISWNTSTSVSEIRISKTYHAFDDANYTCEASNPGRKQNDTSRLMVLGKSILIFSSGIKT